MHTKHTLLIVICILSLGVFSQKPLLNSKPGITAKVLYLDFDGQKVIGTAWNNGALVNAAPSNMSNNNIIVIWKRVMEDYMPFDINVTTDSARYNNAQPNTRQRVIITPTSAWYGSAGGVSYLGSFTWGGNPGTPNWVFENQLGNNVKSVAEAASHEVGHALTLRHQSSYNVACVKTEYNPGTGTGVTSWAPIMGVGYSKNVTIWHNGKSTACTTFQNDLSNTNIGLTGPGYLNFMADDVGDTYNTAKYLNLNTLLTVDSGLISETTDMDAFKFTLCANRYVSFSVKPWALDTVNYSGANLDIRFALYNSSNTLLATDTSLTRLHTLVGLNLTPGSYYFTIDGGRSNNYPDYGSLGRYYMSIKATNPPAMANTIVTPSTICVGQTASLSYLSNGTPSVWQWTVNSGSSTNYTVQNPSVNFSTAGVYTISLLATNPSSTSCISTTTLNIGAIPNLSITNINGVVCPGKTATLTASGATNYLWQPGGYTGATQILSPLVTTGYTVTGSNGSCFTSLSTTVNVVPDFNVLVSPASTFICNGEATTLTASGAGSFTFMPGGSTSNPVIVTPTISTTYTIVGNNNGCMDDAQAIVNVNPPLYADIIVFSPTICIGKSATLAGSNVNNYTINPGGITTNPAILSPTATTIYSIIASNNNICYTDTTILITVIDCAIDGIQTNGLDENTFIYPNPAHDFLVIETNGNMDKLQILNILGEVVYSQDITDVSAARISTANWARGIYLISLQNKASNRFNKKVLLE